MSVQLKNDKMDPCLTRYTLGLSLIVTSAVAFSYMDSFEQAHQCYWSNVIWPAMFFREIQVILLNYSHLNYNSSLEDTACKLFYRCVSPCKCIITARTATISHNFHS